MNRFALALCLVPTACSVSQPAPPAPSEGANGEKTDATSTHGLRPSYSACIDSAEAVIPATQACIEKESAYQRDRLARALEAAKQKNADQAGTIQFRQTAWQADVDAKCKWDAGTEGQEQRIEAGMCSLEAIAARADELSR